MAQAVAEQSRFGPPMEIQTKDWRLHACNVRTSARGLTPAALSLASRSWCRSMRSSRHAAWLRDPRPPTCARVFFLRFIRVHPCSSVVPSQCRPPAYNGSMWRDPSLHPLSHQHQHGLALCVLIERGLKEDRSEKKAEDLSRSIASWKHSFGRSARLPDLSASSR